MAQKNEKKTENEHFILIGIVVNQSVTLTNAPQAEGLVFESQSR